MNIESYAGITDLHQHAFILSLAAVIILVPAKVRAEPTGHITASINQVFARSGATGQSIAGKVGVALLTGDSIRTGPRSSAVITFTDGSVLRLGELTEITVRGTRVHDISLNSGSVLGSFTGSARIRGRFAVAAVRGTKIGMRDTGTNNAVTDYRDGKGSHNVDVVSTTVIVPGSKAGGAAASADAKAKPPLK
jgi:hypothetical protein